MNNINHYFDLSDEQLQGIHAASETFEQALQNEQPICIEDWLAAAAEEIRCPLFRELLAIDVERQMQRNEPAQISEYHARFPGRLVDIERVFQEVSKAGSADALPKKLGRYRIEHVLGTGAFGRVYRAYDDELNRPVAIKVPHASLISRPDDAIRYRAEARMVANLDHPHIVPVQDVGSTDDCPCFIVFKYLPGTDLATRLKQARLSYTAAAELVATLAEALHYAHSNKLVHRDVKPGNILVDPTGKAYLVDFGLALRDQDLGHGPRVAGTPHYMSPEQASGEGHRVDGRSDIYSLGAVFYELLVGRRTFSAETQSELLEQIITQDPKPPRQIDDQVPKELERICLKALSKRASERFTTALDMAVDLRHFLGMTKDSSGRFHSVEVLGLTIEEKKRKRLGIFIGLGLIFLLSLLLWQTTLRTSSPTLSGPVNKRTSATGPDALSLPAPQVAKKALPPPASAPFAAAEAKGHQEAWAKHLGVPVDTTSQMGMKLILIPPTGRSLPNAYYLGKYEVTQEEWQQMMDDNPSGFGPKNPKVAGLNTSRFPVEQVSWFDGLEFCNKLSESEGLSPYYELSVTKWRGDLIEEAEVKILGGSGYHVPTDPEWEHACRAGMKTKYYFGDQDEDLVEYAWFEKNSEARTHTVGEKKPNAFGLYDMHGNVWEWCADEVPVDPKDTSGGPRRMFRGGSLDGNSGFCQAAYFYMRKPSDRSYSIGLRVARVP